MSKICTDISQSKTLAEILPIKSADMFYTSLNRDYPWIWIDKHLMEVDDIPCWSLAALLDVMPHIQEFYPIIEKINDKFVCRYKGSGIWTNGTNPVDACYEMLVLLHKENLI